MIFAEMEYQEHYLGIHTELAAFMGRHFSRVESGLQGDSWIWVLDGEEKVAIDTFTSMKHQIKSPRTGSHVERVIGLLLSRYPLRVYEIPELEGHEDGPIA